MKVQYLAMLACAAAVLSCRPTVQLGTDGTLTEYSVVLIGQNTRQRDSAAAPYTAFYGREGYKATVPYTVPRARANSVFTATLVPDYRVENNEIQKDFIPAQTRRLTFSQDGISVQPRSRSFWPKKKSARR